MIFAVILSSLISSPRLGQFFDLAAWVPTSVSDNRQFGSESATNMSRRVTEDTLAAVNSIFEGWCERCYYPSCGTNNSWQTVDWGTPVPNSRFRFDAPAAHFSTNISPVRTPLFVYDPDTNRVCRTRRLVEYDNLKALADALISPRYRGLDYRIGAEDLTETYRPTWPRTRADAPDWDWGYDRPLVWWSSSAFDDISEFPGDTGDIDPPEFDWMGPAAAVAQSPYKWQQVGRRFVDTYPYDTGLLIDWSTGSQSVTDERRIPFLLFDAVDYNEFDRNHGVTETTLYGYIHAYYMASNTMYVLRSAFPGEVVASVDKKHNAEVPSTDDTIRELALTLQYDLQYGWVPPWYATNSPPTHALVALYSDPSEIEDERGELCVPVRFPGTVLIFNSSWPVADRYYLYSERTINARLGVAVGEYPDAVVEGATVVPDDNFDASVDTVGLLFSVACDEDGRPQSVTPVGWGYVDGWGAPNDMRVLQTFPIHPADVIFHLPLTNRLCKIESITNVTRRLVSEPIAGMSQVVSCLDRSYSLARFPPFSTVTNFHHNSHLVGEKELQYDEVSVSGYGNQLVVTLSDSGDKRFACENFTSNVSTYASSSGNPRPGTMFVRVSPVEEGLNRAAVRLENLIDVSAAESMEEVQAWLAAETNDYTAISSVAYADSMGSALHASATLAFGYNNPSPGVSAYLTLSGDELKGVIASAAFTRQYEREHSLAPSDEDYAAYDVVWPGRYDGRVGTAALWTLMSSADTYVTGSDYDLDARFVDYSASPWDSRSQYHGSCHSDTQYRSALDTYTDVGTCVSSLKDATDAVHDKCLEEMRNDAQDFEDPDKFINPMCRRAVDYLQHMSLPGTISFSIGVYGDLYLSGTDVSSGTNATVITQMIGAVRTGGGWVLHDDLMSLVVDPYAADTTVGVILHFSQDPSDSPWYYGSDLYWNDRFRGAVSNGKVSGVHRVDWSFNALRRYPKKGTQP